MHLNILHTISGIAILLFLFIKIILHLYLDHSMDKESSAASIFFSPLIYLKPYKRKVPDTKQRLVPLCNLMLILCFASLIINLLIGFIIFFQN